MKQTHSLIVLVLLGILSVAFIFTLIDKQLTFFPSSQPETTVTPAANGSTLANPASVNCGKQGGTTVIKKNGTGGEYGLCEFEDNMACEEWALLRGECPEGGRKTTGYDTIQQMYCAWLGGKTLAAPDAQCALPSNKTCSADAVYNGNCE